MTPMVAHGLRLTNPQDQGTQLLGAVVAAAADAVARNKQTDIIKKRRSFLRLFYYFGVFRRPVLNTDTYVTARPKPSVGGGRRRLHVDHATIGIQHGFMHHFGQCRMREDGVH